MALQLLPPKNGSVARLGWSVLDAVPPRQLVTFARCFTADQAAVALDGFEAAWGGKYASIAPAWRRAWEEVTPFFAFPPAVRKSIKTRGSFPTEEAATKLICLAIRNFGKGGRNTREWFAARNQFDIMFAERFNA